MFADTGIDWVQVNILITIVGLLLKSWYDHIQMNKQNVKIDNNTEITKVGTETAAFNAASAADTADKAKAATEKLSVQMNGGLDAKIRSAIASEITVLSDRITRHAEANEQHRVALIKVVEDVKSTLATAVVLAAEKVAEKVASK